MQSDTDSILTEDFANKFSEMVVNRDDSGIESSASRHHSGELVGGVSVPEHLGDTDSVRTEDFQRDLKRTLNQVSDYLPGYSPTSRFVSRSQTLPAMSQDLDQDSVFTDDYEKRFQSLLVRGPTGSDPDRGNRLKERVSNLFNVPESSVQFHSETPEMDRVEQKYREIMARRRGGGTSRPLSRSLTLPPANRIPLITLEQDKLKDDDRGTVDEDYSTEIRSRSRQIQQEIEEERHRRQRSVSPVHERHRVMSSGRGSSHQVQIGMDDPGLVGPEPDEAVRQAKQERQRLIQELRELQTFVKRSQEEAGRADQQALGSRTRVEEARNELTLLDLRKESAMRQLIGVTDEVAKKRLQLKEIEDRCRVKSREHEELERVGLTRDEIDSVIAERDELYKMIKNIEDNDVARFDLEKQLAATQDELTTQSQMSREQIIHLQQELDASIAKLTETRREKDEYQARLLAMENQVLRAEEEIGRSQEAAHLLQNEYHQRIQRKLEEYERDKVRVQEELRRIEKQRSQEEAAGRSEMQTLKEHLNLTKVDLERSRQENDCFRDELLKMESELSQARQARASAVEDYEDRLRKLDAAKDREIASIRDCLLHERETATAELHHQIDHERQLMESNQTAERAERTRQMATLEEEVSHLRNRAKQLEAALQQEHEVREIEMRETLLNEMRTWEREQQSKWQQDLSNLRHDSEKAIREAQEEGKRQGEVARIQMKRADALQTELEEEKRKLRAFSKDKQSAINHLKEIAKDELVKEIARIRSDYEKTTNNEVRRQVEERESELARLREEKEAVEAREGDLRSVVERTEKAVVHEINEECKRLAHSLGVMPRKVLLSNYEVGQPTNESPVTSALANLQACGGEIRVFVEELRAQVASQASQLEQLEGKTMADIQAIRNELQFEKSKDLAALRERLLKDHLDEITRLSKSPDIGLTSMLHEKQSELTEIQRRMYKWKEETAERIAAKLKDEFKKEIDKKHASLAATLRESDRELASCRREMNRLERELRLARSGVVPTTPVTTARLVGPRTSRGPVGVGGDGPASGVITHLKQRIKDLRDENVGLRRGALFRSGSNPNLSTCRSDAGPKQRNFQTNGHFHNCREEP